MKITEETYDVFFKAENILGTSYMNCYDDDNMKAYIDTDEIVTLIEDLLSEIDRLNEKIEDMEEDIRDNYRPISLSEQYDVSDCDFI